MAHKPSPFLIPSNTPDIAINKVQELSFTLIPGKAKKILGLASRTRREGTGCRGNSKFLRKGFGPFILTSFILENIHKKSSLVKSKHLEVAV